MGIKEEPTYIETEKGRIKNPLFGAVHIVKNSEMKVENNFEHTHFWEVEQVFDDFINIKCQCGKGKMISKDMKVKNGKII